MPPTRSKKSNGITRDDCEAESPSEEETCQVSGEITSIYQKLLDGKYRFAVSDDCDGLKEVLTEANNVIRRVKGAQGTIKHSKQFYLLCYAFHDLCEDTNTVKQKFNVGEYAHNLCRKFNFSTDNSGDVIVTKLQVVILGKEISKYFMRAPTIKFALGALDTGEVTGETTAKIGDLPNELLRSIFLMLSLEDRKNAVLVNQRWRRVGEDPVVWKLSVVNIRSGEDLNKLSHSRIRYVQQIILNLPFDGPLEEFLKATLELPKLKQIKRISWYDLRAVNSQLLGRALVKLEKLSLFDSTFTTEEQKVAIFKGMAEYSLIQDLFLSRIDFRTLELDPEVLSKAMSDVRQLSLNYVSLTKDQTQKLFKSISEKNWLNFVSFRNMNLSSVESEIFWEALTQVETVRLLEVKISSIQTRAISTEKGLKSRIRSLAISRSDLSAANPKLLAGVLSKLEEVELSTNNLTNEQVQALFTELRQNCQLKKLNLTENDLSLVDADDLATVVTIVEEVDLTDTQLSSHQIITVLTWAQENSKLKRLYIAGNSFIEVEPAIVKRARKIMDVLGVDSGAEWEENQSDEDEFIDDSESELDISESDEDKFIYDSESESEVNESFEDDFIYDSGSESEVNESDDGDDFIYDSDDDPCHGFASDSD